MHTRTLIYLHTHANQLSQTMLLWAPRSVRKTIVNSATDSLGVKGMPGNFRSQRLFLQWKLLLKLKLQATLLPELALFLSTSQMQ